MSDRIFIAALPAEQREALDNRLRESDYSGIDAAVTWLRELGHNVSRSAMGRYIRRMRLADCGLPLGHRATASAIRHRRALLQQLGALRVQEAKLLGELLVLQERGPGKK